MAWETRDLTVAEAANMSGLHRATLDVIIHRARHLDVLFSERRKHRRWFSPKDIAVLRVAYDLERAGRDWATALAQSYEHLSQTPPHDALLIVPVMSVSARSGRVVTGLKDITPTASFITLPIGKIAAEIQARCKQLQEAPSVAVQN
ncbi:hypothetical protein [Rhizobium mesoamericanum]|uniref:HTH merR-type domain-containing protein n=1 Tax=Rhizobium mesoamericanum STM3625 TaxID=1211777 RepID=K0PIC4_9HYPH|nr:hypothetical protein [Rhizobium mesoamericanum]CCM76256.1 hypothetical protein BN77_0047 [Rhizobium mesoamericanum STM3625]